MSNHTIPMDTDTLKAMIDGAIQAERERCAKIAEIEYALSPNGEDSGDRIAAKIRDR